MKRGEEGKEGRGEGEWMDEKERKDLEKTVCKTPLRTRWSKYGGYDVVGVGTPLRNCKLWSCEKREGEPSQGK